MGRNVSLRKLVVAVCRGGRGAKGSTVETIHIRAVEKASVSCRLGYNNLGHNTYMRLYEKPKSVVVAIKLYTTRTEPR